ncbi:MAG: hypothetical protein JWQ27_3113 [Ferruginibacter sp.]|nr:hypothetical protein [Ferruginibacter sp.]
MKSKRQNGTVQAADMHDGCNQRARQRSGNPGQHLFFVRLYGTITTLHHRETLVSTLNFPMYKILLLLWLFAACNHAPTIELDNTPHAASAARLNDAGSIIRERIPVPEGYTRVTEDEGSFGKYLEDFPLETAGSKIIDYRGAPIPNQDAHVAVLKMDVGTRDLQQCADAVIRLRAEYFYSKGLFDKIAFHFTSGDLFSWAQYKNGYRAAVNGNNVSFVQTAAANDSRSSFRNYLDALYNYAGTISVYKETVARTADAQISTGNILISPGSPGHVAIIVGKAVSGKGKAVYLLAEGYTPAQSVHIINNPWDETISPWYELSVADEAINTARYRFNPASIRSWKVILAGSQMQQRPMPANR